MACPRGNRRARDAPRVDVEIQAAAKHRALAVLRLRSGCGLLGVDPLERLRVGSFHKDEAGACLGERIELHALPFGRLLEVRERDVLVREARHRIVVPDHRDVPGTRLIGGAHEQTREQGALNGCHEHDFLPRHNIHALADDELRVALDLRFERGHAGARVLDSQSSPDHLSSFARVNDGLVGVALRSTHSHARE